MLFTPLPLPLALPTGSVWALNVGHPVNVYIGRIESTVTKRKIKNPVVVMLLNAEKHLQKLCWSETSSWLLYNVVQYNAKGGSSFFSVSFAVSLFHLNSKVTSLTYTHTHTQTKCMSQFFIPCGNEYCHTYFKCSRISAYKSWSDPSHSLFLWAICTIKCKHTVTQTATGHFIFKKVKGHSIWQYSIAYNHEMNHDRNKIDN